jgi:hypothetical protein
MTQQTFGKQSMPSNWNYIMAFIRSTRGAPTEVKAPPHVALQPNAGNSSSGLTFLYNIQGTTVGRIPWMSDQLVTETSDNTQQTLMLLAGCESTISVHERVHPDALNRRAPGIGFI